MRLLTILGFALGLSLSAQAVELTAPANCPAPEPVLSYKGEQSVQEVVTGKVTATVRKGIRCFKVGDKLTLINSDDKAKTPHGQLVVETVKFVEFADLTETTAKRQNLTLEAAKAKLVEIYGEEIKKTPLTVVEFKKM